MPGIFRVEWNAMNRAVVVTRDAERTSLPAIPAHLDADLDAWEQHLAATFTPSWDDDLAAGRWSSEEDRWWFVHEARRIERELRKAIPRSRALITVSAFPGVIPLRFFNDYGTWPLWSVEGGVGPEDFPMLSDSLRDDLISWSMRHETGDAGTEGHRELLHRLRAELGPLYEVY